MAERTRGHATVPTGVERRFGAEEIIVTKTDTKGRITYANDVFLRVACFTEREVLGMPHNIIRHPDMPAAVFEFMWGRIAAGHEVFALVNNLAADGAFYWVFAHVTPTFDKNGVIVGYHSSRRCPERAAVAAVEPVYRAVRAIERDGAPGARQRALDLLVSTVTAQHSCYDEFIWSLIEPSSAAA